MIQARCIRTCNLHCHVIRQLALLNLLMHLLIKCQRNTYCPKAYKGLVSPDMHEQAITTDSVRFYYTYIRQPMESLEHPLGIHWVATIGKPCKIQHCCFAVMLETDKKVPRLLHPSARQRRSYVLDKKHCFICASRRMAPRTNPTMLIEPIQPC